MFLQYVPLEVWNTLGTYATCLVIAGTAVAALVQLRHARGGNQISVLRDLNDKKATPEFVEAVQFVLAELPEKIQDKAFRYQVAHAAARTQANYRAIAKVINVGNYYEETGLLCKYGLIDCDVMLNMLSGSIVEMWDALSNVAAILRDVHGLAVWENFEYVTVISQDWLAKHGSGTYPANSRRIALHNRWREADEQYAASLAT